MNNLLKTIIEYYLNSPQFNGLPIRMIKNFDLEEAKKQIYSDMVESISNSYKCTRGKG